MKFLLILLSFVLGFILLNLEYIIASICLLIFIILILIFRKIPLKAIFKCILTTFVSLTIYCTIYGVSSSSTAINEQIFIVKRARENYVIISNYFNNLYMYEKGNNYDEGDILRISGNVREFSTTTIESQYDFTDYLKTYCVKNRVYASKVEVIIDNPFSTKDFSSRYLDQYNDDAKFVISSINFGSKNYDSDLMNEYKDLSVISLLANSGMFFSFVIEAFTLIFVLKLSDNKAKAVSLALCFPYLLFNLFSFGLFKVFLVKTLQLIFKNNKKFEHFGHLEILSIACTILLIFDPTAITRLEFALSFILSFIYVILMNDLRRDDQSFKTKFITNFKIKVIIFMFFIPINLSMNNSVNIFTLFSQIIFIPVYKVCYFVSFISFFIGYNPILDGLYFVTNRCVTLVSDYTPSIYAPEFNPWLTLVFYLIFFIFILLLEKKLYILNKKIAFLSIFGLLIYFLPIKNLFTAEVVFINVGQGDSILIHKNKTNILIDTGGSLTTHGNITNNTLLYSIYSSLF